MADRKITQLTPLLGANAVAADELVIVDVTDTTMSASGTTKKIALSQMQAAPYTAGTVNSVAYLNGSKVLTTGSALTFDGTNLGIGTTSPAAKLDVAGGIIGVGLQSKAVGGEGGELVLLNPDNATIGLFVDVSGTDAPRIFSTRNNVVFQIGQLGGTGGLLDFYTSSAPRMRIDAAGNVGIGTSSPSDSAILDAQSTTKGVRMPNMTTTQKNAIASPAAGLMVFDITLSKLCVYSGAGWETITSA